eukprot:7027656-Prymnesium_polylepis.1
MYFKLYGGKGAEASVGASGASGRLAGRLDVSGCRTHMVRAPWASGSDWQRLNVWRVWPTFGQRLANVCQTSGSRLAAAQIW